MKMGDSILAKLIVKAYEICQVKGSWMKMDIGNNELMMVKFKDYGFSIPKKYCWQRSYY